jgi:hypothetical protein
LLSILPHDRDRRLQADPDAAALIDKGALGGNSLDDILGSQYRRHPAILRGYISSCASVGFKRYRPRTDNFRTVIPEIDIWRAANLMLKRYGERALEESVLRADELAADGDHDGVAVWRRIMDAVAQLANKIPPGPVH